MNQYQHSQIRLGQFSSSLFVVFLLLIQTGMINSVETQSPTTPKRYALLVAVTKYEASQLNTPPLQFPEADARELADRLREGGYEVDLILGAEATKQALLDKLSEEKVSVRKRCQDSLRRD